MKEKLNQNTFALKSRELWLYTKYQLISKIIVGAIALPIFKLIIDILIKNSGRTNLSSGDYIGFLLSINGIAVIVLGIVFLAFVIGIDINAFIIISALIEEKRFKIKVKHVLMSALRSLKYFFSPIGLLLLVFISFILPLLELGISITPLKNFKIRACK